MADTNINLVVLDHRQAMEKAVTALGAEVTGGGTGFGQSDFEYEYKGRRYEVTVSDTGTLEEYEAWLNGEDDG